MQQWRLRQFFPGIFAIFCFATYPNFSGFLTTFVCDMNCCKYTLLQKFAIVAKDSQSHNKIAKTWIFGNWMKSDGTFLRKNYYHNCFIFKKELRVNHIGELLRKFTSSLICWAILFYMGKAHPKDNVIPTEYLYDTRVLLLLCY